MMKRLTAFVLLFALAFGLSGCEEAPQGSESSSSIISTQSSSSSSQSKPEFNPGEYAVAICMSSMEHPVHRVVQLGFVEKAKELGYSDIFVSGLSEGSIAELIEKWSGDIDVKGVDGAAVWTGDDSCYQLLSDLHKQGIRIVVPFFAHSYENTHDYIDINLIRDEYAMGAAAANFLVEKLEEKGVTEGSLGVSLGGSSVSSMLGDKGFRERIVELDCGFTVLDVKWEGAEVNGATAKITQYITENPNIMGAFGGVGVSAQSWSAAKENLNRQDIVVVALDFTSPNLDILQAGGVDALVAQPLYESGSSSAAALDQLLRGKEFTKEEWSSIVDFDLVTADGEGKNGLQCYYDLFDQVEAFDWDKYMA